MTRRHKEMPQEHSSSDKTAESIQFEQIVELGRKIISEFESDRSSDMLCRWMASRIAELIERSSNSTSDDVERVKGECTGLILSLWSKRRFWPEGDPFVGSRKVLKALETPEPYGSHNSEEIGPGFALWSQLSRLSDDEFQFTLNAALLDVDIEKEKRYLADHQELLEAEQVQSMQSIISRIEAVRAGNHFDSSQPQLHKLEKDERRVKISGYLRELNERRQKVVEVWLSTGTREDRDTGGAA